jgi:shikimate kinase
MQEECEKMAHEDTVCIYLKASVDTLLEHLEGHADGRPLLNTASVMSSEVETSTKRAALKERILDLMAKRATTYERTAHHIIDTDNKTIEEIAAEICCILNCQA